MIRFVREDEKLCEVEEAIILLKRAGAAPERIAVHASIAAEIRARRPTAPSAALVELERRLDSVARSMTRFGYAQGALVGLAQELIGRWPVVKLALEKFGAEVEG